MSKRNFKPNGEVLDVRAVPSVFAAHHMVPATSTGVHQAVLREQGDSPREDHRDAHHHHHARINLESHTGKPLDETGSPGSDPDGSGSYFMLLEGAEKYPDPTDPGDAVVVVVA